MQGVVMQSVLACCDHRTWPSARVHRVRSLCVDPLSCVVLCVVLCVCVRVRVCVVRVAVLCPPPAGQWRGSVLCGRPTRPTWPARACNTTGTQHKHTRRQRTRTAAEAATATREGPARGATGPPLRRRRSGGEHWGAKPATTGAESTQHTSGPGHGAAGVTCAGASVRARFVHSARCTRRDKLTTIGISHYDNDAAEGTTCSWSSEPQTSPRAPQVIPSTLTSNSSDRAESLKS